MAERCPGARALGPAVLPGWRFWITTRGSASIVPDGDYGVHGVLWTCEPYHIHTLDAFEGVGWRNYFRRTLAIEHGGDERRAFVYVSSRRYPGLARPNYMLSAVIPGARWFGLPDAYIEELYGWLPGRIIGANGPGQRYRGTRSPLRFPH